MSIAASPRACALALLLLAACVPDGRPFEELDATPGPADAAADGGVPPADADAPLADAGAAVDDAGAPADAGPEVMTVEVGHARELRGVWVATVSNIDFPSRQGLSAAAQQAELVTILETMGQAGLNAIFFQVRPECDALYASSLEPWSRYLTGTQGGDPGYDPLAYLIAEAHARNIEVHAWFNPYRAKANFSSTAVAPHPSVTDPQHAHRYGNFVWMDPGAASVQAHTRAVILDVVERYDVDGIHFDDYFYPYPEPGVPFPDQLTWAEYQAAGGTLARDDWRRDNVNRLMRDLSAAIAEAKPHVRFGISPFGIYRPGIPPGITGLDQYAAIFADPLRWMEEGWVDYLAPQLYWPTTQERQAYGTLIAWWSSIARDGRAIFTGNYLSQLGSSAAWTLDEFRAQIELSRQFRDQSSLGNIYFSMRPLRQDREGIVGVLRSEFYAEPALTPPLAVRPSEGPAPPRVALSGRRLTLEGAGELRAFGVYRAEGAEEDAWRLVRLIPGAEAEAELDPGRYAVSAVDRFGAESAGVVVEVP